MHIVKRLRNNLLVIMLAMAAFSSVAGAAEGRILYVSGGAYVERGTDKIPARKDMLVESGDVLVTEDDGRMQWRMADDSYFAIRPSSRFKIEDFKEPAADGAGKAFYSLLKGGYRSITGLIGKKDPAAYRVTSPVATMGIRGTDHTHILCQADCGWAPGGKMADGLYTRVDSGSSVLNNPEGTLDVKAGQYALTASPPALLSAMPFVFASWAIDFAIDTGAVSAGAQSEGSIRIEPGEIPSPSQP